MPQASVEVTAYEVSALPAGHRFRRHFTIHVARVPGTDDWVLRHRGAYLDRSGDSCDRPVHFDQDTALVLARTLAPDLEVTGVTPTQALARKN